MSNPYYTWAGDTPPDPQETTRQQGWREACEAMAEWHEEQADKYRQAERWDGQLAHTNSAAHCRQIAQDGPDKRGDWMIDLDECFAGKRVVTTQEFAALSAGAKGYAVYMLGSRDDQPNVPETYTPTDGERADYAAGQMHAAIEAQEMEE